METSKGKNRVVHAPEKTSVVSPPFSNLLLILNSDFWEKGEFCLKNRKRKIDKAISDGEIPGSSRLIPVYASSDVHVSLSLVA